jgi:UDP-2,4-diacetamido-2,4,6-trideoxy-beta-L-altropyranose hydrolase
MLVLIRADAEVAIGTGHVMRCATIGMRLKQQGALVYFAGNLFSDKLSNWLKGKGFKVSDFKHSGAFDWKSDLEKTISIAANLGKIDLLIVDHYILSKDWEVGMRNYVKRILVIDDLANRCHDCDILLDPNLRRNSEIRYNNLVPHYTKMFTGPKFALIRSEFYAPELLRDRDGTVRRILIFLGGTDPGNQIIKIILAIKSLHHLSFECVIVLGPAHPEKELVHTSANGMLNMKIFNSTNSMAHLMSEADLAIGTCGGAAWERCILGLPTLAVVTAENQREDAEIMDRLGAIENLGNADDVSVSKWSNALYRASSEPERIRQMAKKSQDIMRGHQQEFKKFENCILTSH